ncbi:MAG: TetR/AcrR family transcriptional regulator [Myxococcota bacterium]
MSSHGDEPALPPPQRSTPGDPARGPGRPRQADGGEDVRGRLLTAATELFAKRGFGEVGVREVANAAGVTPAMVSYYFGDKQGLYEAMLERVFQNLMARVSELARHESENEDRLSSFVRLHIATLAHDPWVPQLILREVLSAEGPLRERFVEGFARRMTDAVLGIIREEKAAGRLRQDLDPQLTVLSLMGLSVFPFLSQPVSGPLLGFELDEAFRDRLILHTVKLFRNGVAGPGHEA